FYHHLIGIANGGQVVSLVPLHEPCKVGVDALQLRRLQRKPQFDAPLRQHRALLFGYLHDVFLTLTSSAGRRTFSNESITARLPLVSRRESARPDRWYLAGS